MLLLESIKQAFETTEVAIRKDNPEAQITLDTRNNGDKHNT